MTQYFIIAQTVDYDASNTMLTLTMMSTPLVINIQEDTIVEGTEDFNVTITSASAAAAGLTIGESTVTVMITDSMDGK